VPFTDDGARRLAVELERADEVHSPPALVWLFDPDELRERRAAMYGRRLGQVLVVRHERGPVDVVLWVCDQFVRSRHE
jgi:hypothetical protein